MPLPQGVPPVVTIVVLSRLTGVAASLARGGGGLGESRRLVRRRLKLAGIQALSERRASNQRDQRESSDKHLHDTFSMLRTIVHCWVRPIALGVHRADRLS